MITEDYVSFEIAKLLKEKGLNCGCISYYEHFSSNVTLYSGMVPEWSDSYTDHNKIDSRYSRPTLQMAMKWLREAHKIHIRLINATDGIYRYELYYNYGDFYQPPFYYDTYEQAAENAIKYCLENLI